MLDINNYVLEKCENFAKNALFRIVTRPICGVAVQLNKSREF